MQLIIALVGSHFNGRSEWQRDESCGNFYVVLGQRESFDDF